MKKLMLMLVLSLTCTLSYANITSCQSEKYHQYVDASLNWYQALVDITREDNPSLADVGQWFLQGRQTHFYFNRTAVDWYLQHAPSELKTHLPIESWLDLSQEKIKALANSEHPLSQDAQVVYTLRQQQAHEQNYALRSAFADLLSTPTKIEVPLSAYNDAMASLALTSCQNK
ncbi:hypothetical protein [Thaumasiovibrio sp. DFM-14]|uniref:hypothetical protein n=1 Tax=Thaumasiovibrio sp. DFM-14 TaxID=3384792 RepID=UPI0039A3A39E